MPLFKAHPDEHDATPTAASPQPRHRLFRRNRSASPPPSPSAASDYRSAMSSTSSSATSTRSGFFFPRRRASADSLATSVRSNANSNSNSHRRNDSAGGGVGVGGRFRALARGAPHNDPRVLQAREKVAAADAAEREADRALLHARARVRDALHSIKALEDEAREETMRAKAKHAEAKLVSKDASVLGRHGA